MSAEISVDTLLPDEFRFLQLETGAELLYGP
jgi:hypothetical protein